ncbi:MAG: hypothetical protein AB7O91_09985 [Sphingomonas sp.]
MTFEFNPADIGDIVEIASIVGTIVTVLVFAIVAYFLVRPKRRRDMPQRPAPDGLEMEEMLALMDRMERRLATLERAIGDDRPERLARRDEDDEILKAAQRRELGRTK